MRAFWSTPRWQEAELDIDNKKEKRSKRIPQSRRNLMKLGIPEDLLPPPLPSTSFVIFGSLWRKANPLVKCSSRDGGFGRIVAGEWNALSEDEKKVYKELEKQNYTEYQEKLQDWVDAVHPDVIRHINEHRGRYAKRILKKRSDGVVNPDVTYITFRDEFIKKYRKEREWVKKEDFLTFTKAASEAWHALPETEKDLYRERYRKDREEYLTRLAKLHLKNLPS